MATRTTPILGSVSGCIFSFFAARVFKVFAFQPHVHVTRAVMLLRAKYLMTKLLATVMGQHLCQRTVYIYIYVYLSIDLSIYLPIHLSIFLPIYLQISTYIYMYTYIHIKRHKLEEQRGNLKSGGLFVFNVCLMVLCV